MKKFFSKLSNKNKLMVCKSAEYGSWIVSLIVAFMTSNVLPLSLTIYIGVLVSVGVSLGIEKKWCKGIRKNYLKELSNEYYLNNKDSICVEKELKNTGVLLRIRFIFSLLALAILLVLLFMLDLAAPIANVAYVFYCGFSLLARHILEKIELSYGTIIRVIEMKKNDVKDVSAVDDNAMERIICERLDRSLDYVYVPFSFKGMKVSATEYREVCDHWNEYEAVDLRRRNVRARRNNRR